MIKLVDLINEVSVQLPQGYEPSKKKPTSTFVQMPKPREEPSNVDGFKLSEPEKDPITGREMQSVEYESSLSIMRKTLNKYHNSLKHIKQSKNPDIAKQAAQLSTMLRAASEKIKTLDVLIKTYSGK